MSSRPSSIRPPADSSSDEKSAVRLVADRTASGLEGVRVLIVEDDPDAREILAMVLDHAGATVATAGTAAGALAELDRGVPDVMLCDITMPDQDGYELLRSVRARPRERGGEVPAVALTAHARDEDRRRSLAAGFQGHMAKPLEPDALAEFVVSILRP
jgi:CheY-like chemotaxis protein